MKSNISSQQVKNRSDLFGDDVPKKGTKLATVATSVSNSTVCSIGLTYVSLTGMYLLTNLPTFCAGLRTDFLLFTKRVS